MKKALVITALFVVALPILAANEHVYQDSTRLAAILTDLQDPNVNLSPEAWKKTASEAYALALRVFTGAGTKAAREARTHVKEMRNAAEKGDAAAARTHASQALPFVYEVIQASTPK